MSNDTAYRTTDPVVLDEWRTWQAGVKAVMDKRAALSEQEGRNLWVNRGFGHGSTRVVGFERFESDTDGDLLADGALVVSSERGQHSGLIVPNLRRKSGKAYADHLREYTTPSLSLTGMATFHVYSGQGGMYAGGPAVFELEGALYAFWPCDDAPHDDNWEMIPLSAYYAAKEQNDA